MSESGYYPPGAEHDPNAPWNQSDDYELLVKIDYYREVVLIQRTHIDEDDWGTKQKLLTQKLLKNFVQ